jgi:hypothetical protein
MATGHDNVMHFLIAYSIVPLHWRHAVGPKGNRVPIAFARGCLDARKAVCAIMGVILLLRDNASYGKTRGICLETDWHSRIKVLKHRGFHKGIAQLCKRLDHGQGESEGL